MTETCPKCNGSGRVRDESGIHTCFDCLIAGRLDNQAREINTQEKPKLRIPEKEKESYLKEDDNPNLPKPIKSGDGYTYY